MKYRVGISIIVGILFAGASVFAAGLSVTPSKVVETIEAGEESRTSLVVSNPTQDVSLIEVYPDDLVQFIRIEPRSFTLEPAGTREVDIAVNFEDEGVYSSFVSVVARPLGDRTFKAGSGIKIPVNYTVVEHVEEKKWDMPFVGIVVLDVVLFVVLLSLIIMRIRSRRRRVKKQ